MVTEITKKDIRHRYLVARGTVDGKRTQIISTNKTMTDPEIIAALEAKVGGE